MAADIDIVIPVYNEGRNIVACLDSLARAVTRPFRVLLCYDSEEDDTRDALASYHPHGFDIAWVRNPDRGALGAVLSGFRASTAPAVLVYPADDDYNAGRVDAMLALFDRGCDIVSGSRFSRGGCMQGCPPLKAVLVRTSSFLLYHLAGVPTRDATNGLRLFSRRVVEQIAVESRHGFAFSLELLVKCQRRGWRVGEVAVQWFERRQGQSRFNILSWLPDYLHWFGYAFATRVRGLLRCGRRA